MMMDETGSVEEASGVVPGAPDAAETPEPSTPAVFEPAPAVETPPLTPVVASPNGSGGEQQGGPLPDATEFVAPPVDTAPANGGETPTPTAPATPEVSQSRWTKAAIAEQQRRAAVADRRANAESGLDVAARNWNLLTRGAMVGVAVGIRAPAMVVAGALGSLVTNPGAIVEGVTAHVYYGTKEYWGRAMAALHGVDTDLAAYKQAFPDGKPTPEQVAAADCPKLVKDLTPRSVELMDFIDRNKAKRDNWKLLGIPFRRAAARTDQWIAHPLGGDRKGVAPTPTPAAAPTGV